MLLVVNAGSSSLKLAAFDSNLSQSAQARVERVTDHAAALTEGLAAMGLPLSSFVAAAHRVVHGGEALTASCRLDANVIAAIEACVPLAPLHNPANLSGIRALAALAPDMPQYASFDTAFHASNPEVARRYALPAEAEALGLRRYGFHGLSYAAIVRKVKEMAVPPPKRLLALHLGNGASLCAIRDGRSVATTMGYSPLSGLTMGSRSGDIDGNAVLRLVEVFGADETARILNHRSGLIGLGRASDMRALAEAGTPEARFARAHFCYWAIRHAGSMVAAMGGVDAIVFTGGIGENDAEVRAEILTGLQFLGVDFDAPANRAHATTLHNTPSRVAIWIVPADEEAQIARETMAVKTGEAQR
jgi:acetate kinase